MSVISPTVTITVHAVPAPSLTLTVDKTDGYIGDTFTFMGTFLQNGTPVSGASITLYQNGLVAGSATTNGAGGYSIPWVATMEGMLTFRTEAAQPPLPPLLSNMLRVPVGLQVSPLPILAAVAAALFIFGKK